MRGWGGCYNSIGDIMNTEYTEVGVTYFCVWGPSAPLTNGCHRRKYVRINLRANYKDTLYIDIYGWSTDIDSKFLKLLQHWNRTANWVYAPLKLDEQ